MFASRLVAHVIPGLATAPSTNTIEVGTATVAIEIGSVPEACARTEPSRAQSRVTGTEKLGTCAVALVTAAMVTARLADRASWSLCPISAARQAIKSRAPDTSAPSTAKHSRYPWRVSWASPREDRPATVPRPATFPWGHGARPRRRTRIGKDETGEEVYSTLPPSPKQGGGGLGAKVSRRLTVLSIFPVILTREWSCRISCRGRTADGKAWPFPAKRDAAANKVMQLTNVWQAGWRVVL
jgi:hypothetical protein